MHALTELVRSARHEGCDRPYSVYSSVREQHIMNAPIIKPLLIVVLAGSKTLGADDRYECPAGHFVFLPSNSSFDMRNIPHDEYLALLIEFEFTDFDQFATREADIGGGLIGTLDARLIATLKQFVEWSVFAPAALWPYRRAELLRLLHLSGYEGVSGVARYSEVSRQLQEIVSGDLQCAWSSALLAARLSLSESSLRRKLKTEGASVKSIVDRARMGRALHLIQSTMDPIGRISELCGFHQQSRFTSKFKHQFGITPTDLRRSRNNRKSG